MSLAVGIGVGIPFGGPTFNIAGVPGFLAAYDLTGRMGNLWQDLARTTAATAATNPVAVVDEWRGSAALRLVNTAGTTRPVIDTSNAGLVFDGVDDYVAALTTGLGSVSDLYIAAQFSMLATPSGPNRRWISCATSAGTDTGSGLTFTNRSSNNVSLFDDAGIYTPAQGGADLMGATQAFASYGDFEIIASATLATTKLYLAGAEVGSQGKSATQMGIDKFALGANVTLTGGGNVAFRRVVLVSGVPDAATRAAIRTWLTQ
jgi:hypothetical protein